MVDSGFESGESREKTYVVYALKDGPVRSAGFLTTEDAMAAALKMRKEGKIILDKQATRKEAADALDRDRRPLVRGPK